MPATTKVGVLFLTDYLFVCLPDTPSHLPAYFVWMCVVLVVLRTRSSEGNFVLFPSETCPVPANVDLASPAEASLHTRSVRRHDIDVVFGDDAPSPTLYMSRVASATVDMSDVRAIWASSPRCCLYVTSQLAILECACKAATGASIEALIPPAAYSIHRI